MNTNNDLLSVTAFFSVLAHALIILGISFKLPDIAEMENTDNTLDVVLINIPNDERSEDAQTVSTHNNAGGGDDNQEASSPTPWKPVQPAKQESIQRVAKQQTESAQAKQNILLGDGISTVIPTASAAKRQNLKATNGTDLINTKSQRQLEKERLIAKLNQRWIEYQKRPRRTFLSPSTKQHDAAKYLDEWRRKVEQVGNANYPKQAKIQNLSGSLVIDVAINQNGTINDIKILNASKHKILNDAAVRFIRNAAPYNAFPDKLKKTSDIIHITRAFHFLGNNRLSSSDASSQR